VEDAVLICRERDLFVVNLKYVQRS
jgi:hypothetical protein